ncbi:hypothetical protein DL96DRAFT_541865 [Flagelloscypha sp. PMI_526]|nr:hypothetical protein DL96DRAFT_541865 [Flagelloscypha sp. PMI_526]
MGSVSSGEPLPFEIIFAILDFALQSSSSTRGGRLRFLLLSRPIYAWILPQLYFSLDLAVENTTNDRSHFIDRTALLATAQPSSLLFTRRLIVRVSVKPFTFSPFSQLSYLSLWGHNCLGKGTSGRREAQAIVMLPLEELFVWEEDDNKILLSELSALSTVWRTLQRFGCAAESSRAEDRPDTGWLKCSNLVQVLVLFVNINWFAQTAKRGITLPTSPTFRTLTISPYALIGPLPIASQDTLGERVKDRRMVVLRNRPQHLFDYPQSFWVNHSAMWNTLLREVESNRKVNEMTVIEELPWSNVDDCYRFSLPQ